ncbi:MAG: hypothetical protein ACKPKO_42795 [Candidatus Fonsibacter sp.]
MLLVISEHTGLLQAVQQPPSEYDLIRLQGSIVEQTLQELVAQHPGAERHQQDIDTALNIREARMVSRVHCNQSVQQH